MAVGRRGWQWGGVDGGRVTARVGWCMARGAAASSWAVCLFVGFGGSWPCGVDAMVRRGWRATNPDGTSSGVGVVVRVAVALCAVIRVVVEGGERSAGAGRGSGSSGVAQHFECMHAYVRARVGVGACAKLVVMRGGAMFVGLMCGSCSRGGGAPAGGGGRWVGLDGGLGSARVS